MEFINNLLIVLLVVLAILLCLWTLPHLFPKKAICSNCENVNFPIWRNKGYDWLEFSLWALGLSISFFGEYGFLIVAGALSYTLWRGYHSRIFCPLCGSRRIYRLGTQEAKEVQHRIGYPEI